MKYFSLVLLYLFSLGTVQANGYLLPPFPSATALCKDVTVDLDAAGNASITAIDIDDGSTGIGTLTLAVTPSVFDCSMTGDNTVTLSVTDDNGSSDCTATISVRDVTPPSIPCEGFTVVLGPDDDQFDMASPTANPYTSASDNCALGGNTKAGPRFLRCTNIGAPVIYTFYQYDQSGNEAECSVLITVTETQIPIASCQDITAYLDGAGNATITPDEVDNASTDNCGITNKSLDQENFTTADLGENTVELTVTDGSGNSANCTATVTIADASLPVEWLYFRARTIPGGQVELSWATATESNNQGFSIERSQNGLAWEEIAFIAGVGTTQSVQRYDFIDTHPLPSNSYYRLRQVDFDGQFEFSEIESLEGQPKSHPINLFPNPTQGSVWLNLPSEYAAPVWLTIFDLQGRQVLRRLLSTQTHLHALHLDPLLKGTYWVELELGEQLWHHRLVLQ